MGEREFLVVERKLCEECDGTGKITTEASSWCDKLIARPTVHICYACKGTGKTLEYTSLREALRAIGEESSECPKVRGQFSNVSTYDRVLSDEEIREAYQYIKQNEPCEWTFEEADDDKN